MKKKMTMEGVMMVDNYDNQNIDGGDCSNDDDDDDDDDGNGD